MEKTKIWIIEEVNNRYFGNGYLSKMICFFLSKEEAQYFIHKAQSRETYFYSYVIKEIEAGNLIKDKDFEKFKEDLVKQKIKDLEIEKVKAEKCKKEDLEKIENIEKELKQYA